jgi:ABC-type multidrug transport system ATPase subunit
MSSHLLRDIERVCDRVIIISNGRMLEHDSIAELKNRHRRIVELAPSAEPERFVQVLGGSGARVVRLSKKATLAASRAKVGRRTALPVC